MNTHDLIDVADQLPRIVVGGRPGLWPRATAFLIRLALEQAIDDFWEVRLPGMSDVAMRTQLVCLRRYANPDVAQRADAVWATLSRACHYHAYELAPTLPELRSWLIEVRDLANVLDSLSAPSTSN